MYYLDNNNQLFVSNLLEQTLNKHSKNLTDSRLKTIKNFFLLIRNKIKCIKMLTMLTKIRKYLGILELHGYFSLNTKNTTSSYPILSLILSESVCLE